MTEAAATGPASMHLNDAHLNDAHLDESQRVGVFVDVSLLKCHV